METGLLVAIVSIETTTGHKQQNLRVFATFCCIPSIRQKRSTSRVWRTGTAGRKRGVRVR